MANLTAVLRKTIDGLPNATPQLRAKVYEKARAAITRQIEAANPPLDDHVVDARYRVLEDAIRETEGHYQALEGGEAGDEGPAVSQPPAAPVRMPPPMPAREMAPGRQEARSPGDPALRESEQAAAPERPNGPEPVVARPAAERPSVPVFPRVTPTAPPPTRPPEAERPTVPPLTAPADEAVPAPVHSSWGEAPPAMPPRAEERPTAVSRVTNPARPLRPAPMAPEPVAAASETIEPEAKVGEIGPVMEDVRPNASPTTGTTLRPAGSASAGDAQRASQQARSQPVSAGIPEADMAGPRYAPRRAARRSGTPIAAGLAILALAGLGTAGWVYQDEIRSLLSGTGSQTASVSPAETTPTTDAGEASTPATPDQPPAEATPPSGTPVDTAAPPAVDPNAVQPRQFTQRLMPDGSEMDAGPGTSAANAFEEGTDVAAASMNAPATTPEPAPATTAETTTPAATPPAASGATLPVGQRAVFYEERSADREGSQQTGNVVWSVISEPPADGQPPEPAIRAVADVPNEDLKMTLTIRRNADTTLPASHVIEILFDTPSTFPGGQIENVQRLALKPTEQARGEPLIGVAGKISDGFFIIALNDLKQAVDSNLGLLGREEWIDIPLAYTTGQRALMSIEKGIPGERAFKEAMDAWAAKT